jgi:P-type conjugative transfer protein TrbJ
MNHLTLARRLSQMTRNLIGSPLASLLFVLALSSVSLFVSSGTAEAAVSMTVTPCTDTVGACAYSYNITMLPTDSISNMSLGVGGSFISSAQFQTHGSVPFGTASWKTSGQPFTFSYNPNGQSGSFTVTWQISSQLEYGGTGNSQSPGNITITVQSTAPSVSNTSLTTAFNTTGSVGLPSSGSVSSFSIASGPSHGAASISGGSAIYTPNNGYVGSDSFTFYASGPGGNSGTATVYVTVNAPPAPGMNGGSITTAYNTQGSTGISGSGYVNGYALCSNPGHGSASISGGTAYYTPNSGYIGSDSFTVYAYGPGGNSGCATISVNVQAPPAPSAANGSITTAYNTAATVTLPGSGVITGYSIVGQAPNGIAKISGSSVTYTPNAGYIGSDSFTYHAVGPGGTSNTATISVTVQAPPAPSASNGSLSVPYNTATSTTLAASGAISSYAIVAQPGHGSVSLSGSTATYTPTAGYTGSDSFTFHVSGPGGTSNTATVSVTVLTPPSPNNGTLSVPYGTAGTVTLTGTGTITSYTIVAQPGHGAVTLTGSSAKYTPAAGFYGSDSFTFKVTGPNGTSPTTGTINVTVGLPPAPTATAGSMTVPYDTPTTYTLQGSGVISGYAIVTEPTNGTVTVSGSTATYTPTNGYIGADSFTFDVIGPGGTSSPAKVSVTVQAPPPPVANNGYVTCPYQQTCTVTLSASGYTSSYQLVGQASNGSCSITGNVLTYTPAWGAVGSDSCTFTATGPGGVSNTATIYITNQAPPLPDPGGSTGTPETSSGGTAAAICAAGQSVSFPVLPGPPTGTSYDPNWCDAQVTNIAQQSTVISNQQSQVANLQQQVALQQQMVQGLGSDSTSATLATVNSKLTGILNQAAGIGFKSQASGSTFASAYPATSTTAGFNGAQLNSAMTTWQANTAAALQNSIAVQNAIAQQQGQVTGAVQNAVTASNSAAGPTAAHQATNQIIAAVTTQLAPLQDILMAQGQAYTAVQAAKQQAGATAAAATTQTQSQTVTTVTAAPGVSDTTHM